MKYLILGVIALTLVGEASSEDRIHTTRLDIETAHDAADDLTGSEPTLALSQRMDHSIVGVTCGGIWGIDSQEFTEFSFGADLTLPAELLSWNGGYTVYSYPDYEFTTVELFLSVSADVPLSPSLLAVFETEEEGKYLEASLGHDFSEWLPLVVDMYLGYNDRYYTEKSGIAYFDVWATIPLLLEPINVDIYVAHSWSLRDDYTDDLWSGISLNYEW